MTNYLEVDSKILEKNLLLQSNATEADCFEKFLRSQQDETANFGWKLVNPTAGFCVKTTDSKNKKVFINICKLDDIPEPKDITEAELLKLWTSDDVPDYRIPLSIQEPHDEFDKSGAPTIAYDVALNTKFFQKVQSNMVFQSFVMQVVLEGLENKYDVELKKEGYVILQNRKSLGTLKPHRIRTGPSTSSARKPLIEEISPYKPSGSGDSVIKKKSPNKIPDYRLFENTITKCIIGEFHLPTIVNTKDVTVDVGENRIILGSRLGTYQADLFIPVKIDESKTVARFNVKNKILSVKMPILSAVA